MDAAGSWVEGLAARFALRASGADSLVEVFEAHRVSLGKRYGLAGLYVGVLEGEQADEGQRYGDRSTDPGCCEAATAARANPVQKKALKRPPVISWVAALAWAVECVSVISPRIIST